MSELTKSLSKRAALLEAVLASLARRREFHARAVAAMVRAELAIVRGLQTVARASQV